MGWLRWSQEESKQPIVWWEVLVSSRQIIAKRHISTSTVWVPWTVEAESLAQSCAWEMMAPERKINWNPEDLAGQSQGEEPMSKGIIQAKAQSNSWTSCRFETKNSPVSLQEAETGRKGRRRDMEWPWLGATLKSADCFMSIYKGAAGVV